MDQIWKVFLLISAFIALQLSTTAHPLDGSKETEATPPPRIRANGQSNLNSTESLIPNTPGVEQFKNDLFSHLLPVVLGEKEDVSGVYEAQQNSSELDLPCTTDKVRIEVISSSFPLPERFFHAPKRCSEEEE